jgi:hypothetical protein
MMFTLLRGVTDWEAYQTKVSRESGYVGVFIDWGQGPREYPCLVSTYLPPTRPAESPRLVSAYVYESDVEVLLCALRDAGRPVTVPAAPAAGRGHPEVPGHKPDQQAQFNRWVSAHLLVQAKISRETGLCKPEQFEEWLLEALELVDEVKAGKEAAMTNPQDKSILDRLGSDG